MSNAYLGKNKSPLYSAAMDLIVKANKDVYEEERDMCQAIIDLFADEYYQGLQQAKEQLTEQLTKQAVIVLIETCRELGVSSDETLAKVIEKYELSPEAAQSYMDKVWKEA